MRFLLQNSILGPKQVRQKTFPLLTVAKVSSPCDHFLSMTARKKLLRIQCLLRLRYFHFHFSITKTSKHKIFLKVPRSAFWSPLPVSELLWGNAIRGRPPGEQLIRFWQDPPNICFKQKTSAYLTFIFHNLQKQPAKIQQGRIS